jgi:hypothetical protein
VQEGISSGKNPIKIELEIKKNKELSIGYPHEICGFLWVFRFPPPIKLTATI